MKIEKLSNDVNAKELLKKLGVDSGGVSILGGSGKILGVVLAVFVMGMVMFGFGLMNVPGIVMSIFIGSMLIGTLLISNFLNKVLRQKK